MLDNLIKQYAGTHYTWDERGNLIERRHNGWVTRFNWDAFDRLTEAKSADWTARFAYDPLGRRIAKWSEHTREEAAGRTSSATETLYGWDGDVLAFESNVGNERNGHRGTSVHYVHEAGSFVPLLQARSPRPIALSPTTDLAALKAGNFGHYDIERDPLWNGDADPKPQTFQPHDIAFYQCDHLGTPMELTDHDGRIAWEANYKAWGLAKEAISEAGQRAGLKNPIRFQGQYFDEETGLHYNRYRYYDPAAGRFVSRDPIGLIGGLNIHAYAPNAIGWVDSLGLTPGTAVIHHYDTGTRTGHYTIKTCSDGSALHTHQVIVDEHNNTTIVNEDRVHLMDRDPVVKTVEIPLPDATAAQRHQREKIGRQGGEYDEATNSCLTHGWGCVEGGRGIGPKRSSATGVLL